MNMKQNLLLAAAFALTAQMAHAITADELAAQYQSAGYGYIQIRTGVSQIKIEAIKDGQKVEVIYDAATGAILKSESESIDTIDNTDQGLRLRKVNRDFVDGNDDDEDDDRSQGQGRGGDDDDDNDSDDDSDNDDNDNDDNDDNDDDGDDGDDN